MDNAALTRVRRVSDPDSKVSSATLISLRRRRHLETMQLGSQTSVGPEEIAGYTIEATSISPSLRQAIHRRASRLSGRLDAGASGSRLAHPGQAHGAGSVSAGQTRLNAAAIPG